MTVSSGTLALLTVGLIVGLFVVFFVWAIRRIRRGGGSLTTTGTGATYEFLNKDRQKASEVVVERKAGKGAKSQESGEPE